MLSELIRLNEIELIGIIGMLLILIAYGLNQTHKWSQDDFKYDFTNFLGGALLFVYAFSLGSIPFLILQAVWALVSLRDCFKDMKLI
ncbi:MAG: hypothetical protein ABIA76_02710 [Candidatus Diapherotrites archaeon]